MGLPTNKKETGCNPTSSNCVVWQGPDIKCINLCKGDTVSEVVYLLATELCKVMELLNVDNYDLKCLEGCPKPADFQELMQQIIIKLCKAQEPAETIYVTGNTYTVTDEQLQNLEQSGITYEIL